MLKPAATQRLCNIDQSFPPHLATVKKAKRPARKPGFIGKTESLFDYIFLGLSKPLPDPVSRPLGTPASMDWGTSAERVFFASSSLNVLSS
jgi:hypothetical protein